MRRRFSCLLHIGRPCPRRTIVDPHLRCIKHGLCQFTTELSFQSLRGESEHQKPLQQQRTTALQRCATATIAPKPHRCGDVHASDFPAVHGGEPRPESTGNQDKKTGGGRSCERTIGGERKVLLALESTVTSRATSGHLRGFPRRLRRACGHAPSPACAARGKPHPRPCRALS